MTADPARQALLAEMLEKLERDSLPANLTRAFLTVPRHTFVPDWAQERAYHNHTIVTRHDASGVAVTANTRPSRAAGMLEALDVQPGQKVLEIGTGTGYNAALLAELVGKGGHVTSVEIDPATANGARGSLWHSGYGRVEVVTGDGAAGYAANAPYDRIIVTASAWDIAPAWVEQLRPDGVLVVALRFGGMQVGAALQPQANGTLKSRQVFVITMLTEMQGALVGPGNCSCRVAGSALYLHAPENDDIDEASAHTVLSDDYEAAQLSYGPERLGHLSYFVMLNEPLGLRFITYDVQWGRTAYGISRYGWGLFSPASVCLVPYGDELPVHIFGGSGAYLELLRLMDAWQAAGAPMLDCYHLQAAPLDRPLVPPPPGAPGARIFERRAFNHLLWLDPPA